MICEHCGNEVSETPKKDKWCMYKFEDGAVINDMFYPDEIPDGWFDSPKAAKEGAKESKPKAKAKKVETDDNSARPNQLRS